MTKTSVNRALIRILIGGLISLIWFSYQIPGIRRGQVDGCQDLNVSTIQGTGQWETSVRWRSVCLNHRHAVLKWGQKTTRKFGYLLIFI
jgi:hypothetical protein